MIRKITINRKLVYISQPVWMIGHWCPGCKKIHGFACFEPTRDGHKWSFNSNYINPSFTPDMKIKVGPKNQEPKICHYYLTRGQLNYLDDCTHSFCGKTVPLPDIPQEEFKRHCMKEYMNGFRQFDGDDYEAD